MAKTYQVKKGDTLSKIAAESGVKLSDISGYRSGDPNKIFEGETLTIGGAPKSEASSYASEVKDQLTGDDAPKQEKGSSIYDSTKLKADKDTYKSKLDSAFKTYQTVQQDTFDDEFEKRGLKEKKEKMSSLDSEIAAKRAERDAALNKVRTNPGLSASQMTGDVKKIADYANDEINGLISQRNALAGEYNTELDEIDGIVSRKASGAKAEYDYYAGLLGNTETALGNYQSALIDELKSEREADQFDRQLAQALEIAQMRDSTGGGKSNLQLRSDPTTGDPLYWFDPDTGAITWVNSEDGGGNEDGISFDDNGAPAAPAAGGTQTKGRWYNPFSWANYFD